MGIAGTVTTASQTNAVPVKVLARNAAPVSCDGTTGENILAQINIPANVMGPNGLIRVWANFTMTNSGNNKTFRAKFSGPSGTTVSTDVIANQAIFREVFSVSNRGATNSQVCSKAGTNDEAGTGSIGVKGGSYAFALTTVDTTALSTIVLTGQKATGTETLTLESYLVELISDGS